VDIQRRHHAKPVSKIERIKEKKIFPHASAHEVLKSWETEEFSYYEKTRAWFLVGGIFFFLIVGYFAYTKELITAATFLLLGITVYLFSLKKPRQITCSITYQAILVDNVTYPFNDLESFWIFYEPPDFKVISLKHKKPYLPHIHIPLGNVDPMEVRKILIELLTEAEQEEAFSDKMARYLRF
jgi:hypothetical protein